MKDEFCTQDTVVTHFESFEPEKMTWDKKAEKSYKTDLWIIFKPHAHLQTMTKTPVKFQRDLHKTVGVVHTGYLLSIHFGSIRAWKMTKCRKKWQKLIRPHALLQNVTKTYVKFQNDQHKTVGRVAHTRYPPQLMHGHTTRCKNVHTDTGWTMLNVIPPFYEWLEHNKYWPGSQIN